MMKEVSEQITNEKISHVILQAGVGGMAAAMVAGIARYLDHIPQIIIVEPDTAACVLESIKTGKIEKISIEKERIHAKSIETIVEHYDQSGNRQRRTRKEEAVQKSAGGRFCHEEKNSLR